MKVLLTGASGFVGSHVLDSLQTRKIPTAILLRPSSDRGLLLHDLAEVEIRSGSITDLPSIAAALHGITHVIHCAGCTKSVGKKDFFEINHQGTLNLVEAVQAKAGAVEQFIHVSSLAVAGPATPKAPVREDEPPRPVSDYGRSKLAGEQEVRNGCGELATIIRPPAVYGPRDKGFLTMFEAVVSHLLPCPSSSQVLSVVFARDLAEAIVLCLEHPSARGKTFFVASPETITARRMAEVIARQVGGWTVPVPLPPFALWPLCLFQELLSRVTRKPALLNLQKFAEIRAPGWVCDASRFQHDLDYVCPTRLEQGVAATLAWYRKEGWL